MKYYNVEMTIVQTKAIEHVAEASDEPTARDLARLHAKKHYPDQQIRIDNVTNITPPTPRIEEIWAINMRQAATRLEQFADGPSWVTQTDRTAARQSSQMLRAAIREIEQPGRKPAPPPTSDHDRADVWEAIQAQEHS